MIWTAFGTVALVAAAYVIIAFGLFIPAAGIFRARHPNRPLPFGFVVVFLSVVISLVIGVAFGITTLIAYLIEAAS